MKTLVVLAAVAAVAIAGPTFRAGDIDLDVTKVGKRSPTPHHHHISAPVHVSPVHVAPIHHTYVQPVIPHHLGLKKPLIVKKPYGHHVFRSEEEQLETHSADSKESKSKCMKEMEAKCDDDVIAKSSELQDSTKIEDIDGGVSDREVAQRLLMAQDAVESLQKTLQLAEKNSRMTQWKHGESESDGKMHENVETAKLALEHMQRNFGNLESMNVHAREFKNAEVHDVNLNLKTDEERLAQWKNAIENIQKNVELVRNIEDSFQHNEHSGKSAVLEKSSSLKHEMAVDQKHETKLGEHSEKSAAFDTISEVKHELSNDHKTDTMALKEEKSSGKHTSEFESKFIDGKSSWQAREHEKSSKSEMETSASTLTESKTSHSHLEKSSDITSNSNAKLIAEHDKVKEFKDNQHFVKMAEDKQINKPMETISQSSLKSSENLEMKQTHLEHEKMAPIIDTSTLMKSAEHHQVEQHSKILQHGLMGHQSDIMEQHMNSHSSTGQSSVMEHGMTSHLDHHKSSSSVLHGKDAHATSLQLEHLKENESISLDHRELPSSTVHDKNAQEMMMKSSDQATGQSQQSAVAVKPLEHMTLGHHQEKLHHTSIHGAHGKSAEDGSLFSPLPSPIEMNSAFKQALAPSKSWKEAHGSSRGAYGSGLALGGGYGAGYGAGSGAVGVFPHGHVGGCAIPLLLSCSPSVVAGSLAKSHSYAAPSYAGSAYRGSENTNSLSKRDITKISRPYKVQRTPTNKDLKKKTILITDKL